MNKQVGTFVFSCVTGGVSETFKFEFPSQEVQRNGLTQTASGVNGKVGWQADAHVGDFL
jgi:hypothetical protein